MKEKSTFYNNPVPRSLTYLEFGSIDTETSEKKIWDFRLHQEAYDFLMLARYMKDLVAFKKLTENIGSEDLEKQLAYYQATVFTKDIYNTFSKLAALHVCGSAAHRPSFLEVGSTLMGCIEALEYIQKVGCSIDASFQKQSLKDVSYHAVDISELLNATALITHPDYEIATHLDWKTINFSYDVLFAKGVSLLYAIASSAEFAQLLSHCRIGSFDYSLALGAEQEQYLGTGKNVRYLAASECIKALSALPGGKELFVHAPTAEIDNDKKRIRALFYYCSQQDLSAVLGEETRLRKIICGARLSTKAKNCLYFGDKECALVGEFMPISSFLAKA